MPKRNDIQSVLILNLASTLNQTVRMTYYNQSSEFSDFMKQKIMFEINALRTYTYI